MKHTLTIVTCLWSLVYSLCACAGSGIYEGDYLYRVSTVRAAPGKLNELIDLYQQEIAVTRAEGAAPAMLMRHSQGDHWDLLLIYPMESFAEYYGKQQLAVRARASDRRSALEKQLDAIISFREDVYAIGPSLGIIRNAHENAGLFHIEMFHALPGRKAQLIEQRRMENRYLSATGQQTNMIFVSVAGTDVDTFTIGFHASLVSFAQPAAVSKSEAEAAARAAGFESRSSIGTYLRELIARHHDTLAVAVTN